MSEDALTDFNKFLMEFQAETDRGAALVGAALIDQRLKETLAAFFADPKVGAELLDAGSAPLGQFSARSKAAFCLGLIDRDEYYECNLIRKIRNAFAHRTHGTTFGDPEIAAHCFNLKMGLPGDSPLMKGNPRLLFTHSVFFIALGLMNRSEYAAQQKRNLSPPQPIIQLEAAPGPAQATPQNA